MICNEPRDHERMLDNGASNNHVVCNPEMQDPSVATQKHFSASTVQTGKGEIVSNKEMPHPDLVIGDERGTDGYDSLVSHRANTQKQQRLPMDQGSCTVQVRGLDQRNCCVSIDHMDNKQGNKSDSLGNENLLSPGKNQSANASSCHSNMTAAQITIPPSEYGNVVNYHAQDGLLHSSMHREAALRKFRLKRKERCFEKKVRMTKRDAPITSIPHILCT